MQKSKPSKLVTVTGALVLTVALGAILLGFTTNRATPSVLTSVPETNIANTSSISALLVQEQSLPFVKKFLELYTTGTTPGENIGLLGDFMTTEFQLRALSGKRQLPYGARSVLDTSACELRATTELAMEVVCPLTVYPLTAPQKEFQARVSLTKKEVTSGWLVAAVSIGPR